MAKVYTPSRRPTPLFPAPRPHALPLQTYAAVGQDGWVWFTTEATSYTEADVKFDEYAGSRDPGDRRRYQAWVACGRLLVAAADPKSKIVVSTYGPIPSYRVR